MEKHDILEFLQVFNPSIVRAVSQEVVCDGQSYSPGFERQTTGMNSPRRMYFQRQLSRLPSPHSAGVAPRPTPAAIAGSLQPPCHQAALDLSTSILADSDDDFDASSKSCHRRNIPFASKMRVFHIESFHDAAHSSPCP